MTITNTKISDLVPNEKVLGALVDTYLAEKNTLIKSGVALRSSVVDIAVNSGPRKVSIPFLKPLDTTEVNVSNDDITSLGNVGKLTADEFGSVCHVLNYGWGYADLATMVTQYDASTGIQQGLGSYWDGIYQKLAISSLNGVKGVNAGLTVGDGTEQFSIDLMIDAATTAGEYMNDFDILIVNPVTAGKLQKANKTDFIPASETNTGFNVYAGKTLVISKAVSKTILARSGALAYGVGNVANAIEIERVANGGNGMGGEILHSRQKVVIHPQGFSYKGPVAPAYADLETASNWELAVPVEQVGFRFIDHA